METKKHTEFSISLSQILQMIWTRKWLFLVGLVLVATLSVWAATLSPTHFKSIAVVSVSEFNKVDIENPNTGKPITGLGLPEFSYFLGAVDNNRKQWRRFLKVNDHQPAWAKRGQRVKWEILPVYAYPKTFRKKGFENFLSSFRVICTGDSPEEAREKCLLVGRYAQTLLLNMKLEGMFLSMRAQRGNLITNLGRRINKEEEGIGDLKERETYIQKEIIPIPGIKTSPGREFTNVNANTERYLSPYQQLVATKMAIKDAQNQLRTLRRAHQTSLLLLEYLEQLEPLFDKEKNYLVNQQLLEQLKDVSQRFFKDKDKTFVQKAAYYSIGMKISRLTVLKDVVYRFLAEPSYPRGTRRRWRLLLIGFFGLLGCVFLVLFILTLEWWRINKHVILDREKPQRNNN